MKNWKIWVDAARPQTLAAGFIPVLAGASLAYASNEIHPLATATALFCALAIQIGTNYANDYFDFKKGADTDQRIGFERATASGKIQPEKMFYAAIISMGLAFSAGLYLVWIGGWVIFLIGVFSLIFGFLYTAGPFPLGYNGLGDLFVFIFFGIIAVMGTFYVNTLQWSMEAFWISIPVGALCVNILVVNNLRDIDQDRLSGKKTLGVIFGEKTLKLEYLFMLVLSFYPLSVLYSHFDYTAAIFLPLLGIPFILSQLKTVWFHANKSVLNHTLERTAQFMIIFGVLLSIGILLQSNSYA